jgi:nucleotide-binding universal stress UspA family protein
MFKKILVPLDGSELAARILPQVEVLARCVDAEITLISVGMQETAMTAGGEGVRFDFTNVLEHMKSTAEAYLDDKVKDLRAKGLKAGWVYRRGVPAREIIAHAAENGMDLIAMATHGMGEIAWVLGSVTEKVASHATVPVLLLRVMEKRPLPESKSEPAAWGSE